MQLHHLMAALWPQGLEIGRQRIGHHQHPQAAGAGLPHGRKQRRPLRHLHKAGRTGHRNHTDGIHPQRRHGGGLIGLAQTAHLEPGTPQSFNHPPRPLQNGVSRIAPVEPTVWVKAGSC